jgi:hypothetical protein
MYTLCYPNLGVKVTRNGILVVDSVLPLIYDQGMRKIAAEELAPKNISLLNPCPKCGGELRATMLIGPGTLLPREQVCVLGCGFRKDISRAKSIPADRV